MPTERWPEVRDALAPLGVEIEADENKLRDEARVRLAWNSNPVHLFFSCDALHEEMERSSREIPFGDSTLPLVAPEHLVIRKTLLGRPKDHHDIEAVLDATSVDRVAIDAWVARLGDN